ncbi:hypothetical protein CDAR_574251 [Caerostris darwini]|uniref:Uncharacterized protein n=1 Tax=Caerostris darwini TaxID=1538125 RepID=A0AAV4PTI2_9ARAC|nr:hypothetical protein CDAR_574251 [Caerostris darwini]
MVELVSTSDEKRTAGQSPKQTPLWQATGINLNRRISFSTRLIVGRLKSASCRGKQQRKLLETPRNSIPRQIRDILRIAWKTRRSVLVQGSWREWRECDIYTRK